MDAEAAVAVAVLSDLRPAVELQSLLLIDRLSGIWERGRICRRGGVIGHLE